jgi:hypothetical protein
MHNQDYSRAAPPTETTAWGQVLWTGRGLAELKGLPEKWRLYAFPVAGAISGGDVAASPLKSALNASVMLPEQLTRDGALWSPVVAPGGYRSQIALPQNQHKQAKVVAVGCDQLPRRAHGKEGVSGSSPEEGFEKKLRVRRWSSPSIVSSKTPAGNGLAPSIHPSVLLARRARRRLWPDLIVSGATSARSARHWRRPTRTVAERTTLIGGCPSGRWCQD